MFSAAGDVMHRSILRCDVAILICTALVSIASGQQAAGDNWRPLPLIADGQVHPSWTHIGWGGFAVEGESLRTECVEQGMGLLVYKAEQFGNCRIRVVYKSKDASSNAGVYVRIDEGILKAKRPPAVKRDADGKLSPEMLAKLRTSAEAEEGPWYAVHHGYEVQICDGADAAHRTGAIYGLAQAVAVETPPDEWKTMIITLKGNIIEVAINGKQVSRLDSESADLPKQRKWTEPKLDSQRPQRGYLGLQNHDPGDVVWFKEVSVQPLMP
jgi:hypothetical protein